MSTKLLWSIVKVNFKKNWIMILSFFVFLVISLSMIFGMTNFIVGLHNELPEETFQKQKYFVNFDTYRLDESKTDEFNDGTKDAYNGVEPNDKLKKDVVSMFKKSSEYSANKFSDEELDNFVNRLLRRYHGSLGYFLKELDDKTIEKNNPDFSKMWNKYKELSIDLENYLLANWDSTDIFSYVLNKNILCENSEFGNVMNYVTPYNDRISETMINNYYIFSKSSSKFNTSIWKMAVLENAKYKNTPNVLYLSPKAEKTKGYKIGQKVRISLKGINQEFIYGGKASLPMTINNVDNKDEYYYYLSNYVPIDNGESTLPFNGDMRIATADTAYDNFLFRNPTSTYSPSVQLQHWKAIAYDQWLKPNSIKVTVDGFFTNSFLYETNLIYSAFLDLTLVFGIILIVLDIIIAWFLIREIIRSLSHELLILRTLGMSNSEASFINSCSLIIILGMSWILSWVGLLGIQALFIDIASQLVDVYFNFSTIQAFALIIIFASIIFLLVAYEISGLIMTKSLGNGNADLTPRSDYRFAWLQRRMFSRNVNLGLTFSFSIKNLNKIITTFFITFLITCISFVALGFKESINQGQKRQMSIVFDQDALSVNNSYEYYLTNKDNKQQVKKAINYVKGELPENEKEGKYLTSNEVEKYLIKSSNKKLLDKFETFKAEHKKLINELWPGQNTDFTVNFGNLYYGDSIGETVYKFTDGFNGISGEDNLIVLSKDDVRYKQIFKHNNESISFTGDVPIVPVTVSPSFLSRYKVSVGDTSGNNLNNDVINFGIYKKAKENITDNNDQDEPQFNVKIANEYDGIGYSNEAYIKQSDFIKLLSYFSNRSKEDNFIYQYIINSVKDATSINAFLNKGVPLLLRQYVIPDMGSMPLKINDNKYDSVLENIFNPKISYYQMWRTLNNDLLIHLINMMIIMLVLILILDVSFIVFMVMSIMSENDNIVFILKALGYQKREIFWRIISGYLIAIFLSIILGTAIAGIVLNILSETFLNILGINLSLYFAGSIIGLFIALFLGLPIIVTAISSYKITKRNLITRDDE